MSEANANNAGNVTVAEVNDDPNTTGNRSLLIEVTAFRNTLIEGAGDPLRNATHPHSAGLTSQSEGSAGTAPEPVLPPDTALVKAGLLPCNPADPARVSATTPDRESFLSVGKSATAPNEDRGRDLVKMAFLVGPAGKVPDPVFKEMVQAKWGESEDDDDLCAPFIDDNRDRGMNGAEPEMSFGSGFTPSERRGISKKFLDDVGWRDHCDGNRITTTAGDKIEIVQGNYKLIVMGRQSDPGAAMGWEASGSHVQDFAGATMPGASVKVIWIQQAYLPTDGNVSGPSVPPTDPPQITISGLNPEAEAAAEKIGLREIERLIFHTGDSFTATGSDPASTSRRELPLILTDINKRIGALTEGDRATVRGDESAIRSRHQTATTLYTQLYTLNPIATNEIAVRFGVQTTRKNWQDATSSVGYNDDGVHQYWVPGTKEWRSFVDQSTTHEERVHGHTWTIGGTTPSQITMPPSPQYGIAVTEATATALSAYLVSCRNMLTLLLVEAEAEVAALYSYVTEWKGGAWLLQNSTERVYQYSRYAGNFKDEYWGDLIETYIGSENPRRVGILPNDGTKGHAPDHYIAAGDPLDERVSQFYPATGKLTDFDWPSSITSLQRNDGHGGKWQEFPSVDSTNLPRGNPHIIERTWATAIDTRVGSVDWRIPEVYDSTHTEKHSVITNASSEYLEKNDYGSAELTTTCSGAFSDTFNVTGPLENSTTVGAYKLIESVTPDGIMKSVTSANVLNNVITAGAIADTTLCAQHTETHICPLHGTVEVGLLTALFIGGQIAINAGAHTEINFFKGEVTAEDRELYIDKFVAALTKKEVAVINKSMAVVTDISGVVNIGI
jgi:hypothetical protein